MQGIVGPQEVAQPPPRIVGLLPAILGNLDAVVGDRLVDLAVFCGWGRRTKVVSRVSGPWSWVANVRIVENLLLPSD